MGRKGESVAGQQEERVRETGTIKGKGKRGQTGHGVWRRVKRESVRREGRKTERKRHWPQQMKRAENFRGETAGQWLEGMG